MGVIYCDGGSNQFGSIYCVVTTCDYGRNRYFFKKFDKRYSVYEIEYLALIDGLNKSSLSKKKVFVDNLGIYKELQKDSFPRHSKRDSKYFYEAKRLLKFKDYVKIEWIPRERNLAGIELEKILNNKKTIKKSNVYLMNKFHQLKYSKGVSFRKKCF